MAIKTATPVAAPESLTAPGDLPGGEVNIAQAVQRDSGENVFLCYQCKKCTSGCPVVDQMDLTPNQIMRALQFGKRDLVLNSKTIWVCASCQTCTARCPQNIDIARVMDTLKIMAQREGVPAKVPAVIAFNQAALRGINLFGRMYELGLIGELELKLLLTRQVKLEQLLDDSKLGVKMFLAGKLKPLPSIGRGRRKRAKRPSPGRGGEGGEVGVRSVAYYPGCSLHSTGIEFDMSTRAACKALDLELVEPEGWVCCGTSPAHSTSHLLATVLPMKSLALAEDTGLEQLAVPCAACFSRFKTAIHDVEHDQQLRDQVIAQTGYIWGGKVDVKHLVDTIVQKVGLAEIKSHVTHPLKGLKVVCYYGCLITRPPEITGAEHAEYPMVMDHLMQTLGAEVLDWSYKTDCCGGSLVFSQTGIALKLSNKILENAQQVGAEAVVVACPLCQANLDGRQEQIAKHFGVTYDLPIIYFTQLLGLAMGLPEKELGFRKEIVSPMTLLRNKGLLAPT